MMETFEGTAVIAPRSRAAWRAWLRRHAGTEQRVWLLIRHKGSPTPSVGFEEAIEEALCFGWIDSKGRRHGDDSFLLCFNRRNPKSTWGRKSRERAARMIEAGLMTAQGQAMIDVAKSAGRWDAHAEAQAGIVPADLAQAFDAAPRARKRFDDFPPSSRRVTLQWISTAKQAETRARRIALTVERALEGRVAGLPAGMDRPRVRKKE